MTKFKLKEIFKSHQRKAHKNARRHDFSFLLTLICVCLSYLFSPFVNAQQITIPTTKSAAVAATTDEVLTEVSKIRNLKQLHAIKSGANTRAEIERMLIENLNRETKPEELRAAELTLKRFGLAPADFNYRQTILDVLTEQVAGYYDPRQQAFNLADWIDLDAQRPVMAHELTHALQDQHFNLRRFQDWKKGDADAELAAQSLVEGDATLVMEQYIQKDIKRAMLFMRAMLADGASSTRQLDRAPASLRRTLTFPYDAGSNFARELWRKGGWDLVSKAYTDLPASSEQIMHPEKYFARESFVKINLPDFTKTLGKGWRKLETDTNGEWSLYLILEQYLKDDDVARRAAAGWNGDVYALYENPKTKQTAIINFTEWDTEQDADEFFDAYVARTAKRYENSEIQQSVAATKPSGNQIQRRMIRTKLSEGDVLIEKQGKQVRIMEGAPEKAWLFLFGKADARK